MTRMRITAMCVRNLFRRRTPTGLCVLGIALGVMLIIAIGATTSRYVAVLREMNEFYQGAVVVIPKGAMFIQAVPLGGFLFERVLASLERVNGVQSTVPMLVLLGFAKDETVIQLVPANVTAGLPAGNWSTLTGSLTLQLGGRWPSASTEAQEVVVGAFLAAKFGYQVDATIEINHHPLTVTGILDTPASATLLSSVVLMTLPIIQEAYVYPQLINMVVVTPNEGVTEQTLADRIDAAVPGVGALAS